MKKKLEVLRYLYHYLKSKIIKKCDQDHEAKSIKGQNTKMKITDLPIDCLEEIFEYLDLINLLKVADSNKRLNIAACFVFRRKHGKKEIKLYLNWFKPETLRIYDASIIVSKGTDQFRILRCFGCVTSNLSIDFDKCSKKQVDKICFNINEYCAESLTKLDINGYQINWAIFRRLQAPFVNIVTLRLSDCHFGRDLIQLNKWFPNIQHLELPWNVIDEAEYIEMCFPNLTYLSYVPTKGNKKYFENLICSSPSLRILDILLTYDRNEHLFQNINRCVPRLEELTINILLPINECGHDQVHFKSLKKFEITDWRNCGILSKFDFTFDHLEEFHVHGIQFNILLTFITKCSTIKKLELHYNIHNDLNTEHALQIAKALPLLSELKLDLGHKLSYDVIPFWNELKQLKKFQFVLHDIFYRNQSKINDLYARLGGKSKIYTLNTCRTRFIILERVIA